MISKTIVLALVVCTFSATTRKRGIMRGRTSTTSLNKRCVLHRDDEVVATFSTNTSVGAIEKWISGQGFGDEYLTPSLPSDAPCLKAMYLNSPDKVVKRTKAGKKKRARNWKGTTNISNDTENNVEEWESEPLPNGAKLSVKKDKWMLPTRNEVVEFLLFQIPFFLHLFIFVMFNQQISNNSPAMQLSLDQTIKIMWVAFLVLVDFLKTKKILPQIQNAIDPVHQETRMKWILFKSYQINVDLFRLGISLGAFDISQKTDDLRKMLDRLGLTEQSFPEVTASMVKKQYRELARHVHPDKTGKAEDAAEFLAIKEARDFLLMKMIENRRF